MNIRSTITAIIEQALDGLGVPKDIALINLDHPADSTHGDYSTNIAMVIFKSLGASSKNPFELAENLVERIEGEVKRGYTDYIEKVEAVKPGFINFYLTKKFFTESLAEILKETAWYGKNKRWWNKRIIIEHTNLNPFKPFHIGHLVNNAVGEALSRLLEYQDVKLTKVTYGGDVGMHVARTIWGVMQLRQELEPKADVKAQVTFLGKAYAFGSNAFDTDEKAKVEIQDINKKIFAQSDPDINELYAWGRKVSLAYFEEVYRLLNSRFDYHFHESEIAEDGKSIVEKNFERGVFKLSDGAIIYPGEQYGLHNRVFITSQGLPTYEAKELGVTKKKFELHDFDESIIVTANEQNDYFKVVLTAIRDIYPEIAKRTKHFGHGTLRLTSGKMSSRKGNIISGEAMIEDIKKMVLEKMQDREMSESEKDETATKVAIAAIKYTILRQSIGKDIIFDPDKSISFEGDSGPYLQYTYVRAKSILAKAREQGIEGKVMKSEEEIAAVEKKLYQFPELIIRAADEHAPHYIATYLIELAAEFNAYYANTKIVNKKDQYSAHKIALTEAISWVIKNGLYVLGIETPERM